MICLNMKKSRTEEPKTEGNISSQQDRNETGMKLKNSPGSEPGIPFPFPFSYVLLFSDCFLAVVIWYKYT